MLIADSFRKVRQETIERESGLAVTFFCHRFSGRFTFDMRVPFSGTLGSVTISGDDVRHRTRSEAINAATRLAELLESRISA
jgi:hypothetical protein